MSKLYDDIAAQDRKLADRWKIRTRDNEKYILTPDDIDFILADVIAAARKSDITENQGAAIALFTFANSKVDEKKSGPAIDRVAYYVNMWEKAFRLNMQPILDPKQLLPVSQLFSSGIATNIVYQSPGTKIIYGPYEYIAVGELIVDRVVTLFMSMTGGLSHLADTAAAYSHEANAFLIYSMDPRSRVLSFIHEATHIIQDQRDVSSFVHHNEADAFISEAVAELTRFTSGFGTGEVSKASLAAARMVIAKTAIGGNPAWETAYKNVVTEVGKLYKKYGVRTNPVKAGEGTSESTRFDAMVRAITAINNARDIAADEIAQFVKRLKLP